jgi:hypothetical protein
MVGSLSILFLYITTLFAAGPQKIQKNIMIDQFGYRPGDKKIAMIADPVIGTNSNERFTPGATYEVRSWDTYLAVFTGKTAVWNHGAIDYTSGDKGWWFDFSPVQREGDYYIYDQDQKVGSYKFRISHNIPESGNGIPDILDEVKYELDWLKKMQEDDGGAIIKVGNTDWNVATPPSTDKRPRYYGPKCSSSTIALAGMFAHAVIVLSEFPGLTGYCEDLETRAGKAWEWYQHNPHCDTCDNGEIKAGDADYSLDIQDQMEVVSAIYLFALTRESPYHNVIKRNFYFTSPFYDPHHALYFSHQEDALLYYTTLPYADDDVKKAILSHRAKQGMGMELYRYSEPDDLYMAYLPAALYNWGSNNPRAALGSANYDFISYNLNPEKRTGYLDRASGILHYFHGVNPLGIVYLSTMYECGAEYCSDMLWHNWFSDGSPWGKNPPPGYVPGGPNRAYTGSFIELSAQPIQKCYCNWNKGWPENSWEITEPAINYQASYVKLLSKFISK